MIRGVIYDVDGVIVDSEPLHIKAWCQTLENFHSNISQLPSDFLQKRKGERPINIAQEFIEKLQLSVDADAFLKVKVAMYGKLMHTDLKLMPGVKTSLDFFENENMAFGIGTSDVREDTEYILQKFGLKKYFSAIVTGDEVKNGKPDPEIYLKVVQKLSLKPQECIVIEDATRGVLAAKNAGCLCIGVKNNTKDQDLSKADIIIDSLEDITIDFWNKIVIFPKI